MAVRIADLLAQQAAERFVGRKAEISACLQAFEPDGPRVVHIHGIAGIGKSTLLAAFAAQARDRGDTVVSLDCRTVEPTERGFLHELGLAIGTAVSTPEDAAAELASLGKRVALALDTYELFRLMDTWLRQAFVPALRDNVRVFCFGREPPVSAWSTSPGWGNLFRSLALGPLDNRDASELLRRADLNREAVERIGRFARGHPLALKLAASALAQRPDLDLTEVAHQRVVEELSQLYLADVRDPLTREALAAASVVRRTTLSLLQAMLPRAKAREVFDRLRTLAFVESARDGLILHDAVQESIAASLRAADPSKYRDYRRAAWHQLRLEVSAAAPTELWRYTADMLYIIQNPVCREAFFPSGAHVLAVEPARSRDSAAIRAIGALHEGPQAARLLDAWWTKFPQRFSAVRDGTGEVVGFYSAFDPAAVSAERMGDDPIAQVWMDHLRAQPVEKTERILFCRRWLSRDDGEAPSEVQAACWLDLKRIYMEMRPRLRRVYVTVRDVATYAPVALELGFRPLEGAEVELDGAVYHSVVLDFGPESVDGWLAGLVAAELGVTEAERILDVDARELVVDGCRVGLTKREFGVMHYLCQNEGKAVSRIALERDVWSRGFDGGTNVVDVVVRSLRKKLGDKAAVIETVTGVGYRFRKR